MTDILLIRAKGLTPHPGLSKEQMMMMSIKVVLVAAGSLYCKYLTLAE